MKILISAYACDPTQGSEAACGWNWAYHTARQGHEVWCMTKIAHRKNILHHMEQEPIKNLHFVFVQTSRWLTYLLHKYHDPVVYFHYMVWQYLAYRKAKEMHREKHFDLVHHASYGSMQLGSHLWKLNIPFVFGPIGGAQKIPRLFKRYMVKGMLREHSRSWVSSLLLYRFKNTRNALRRAQLVLATNQETYDLVKKLGAKQVRLTLDGGISDSFIPATFPVRPTREIVQVLWIGRFISHKGLSLVIDVFDALKHAYPIHLNVIGDGPLAGYYRQRVTELELTDTIAFYGRLPYHALKQHYAHSDIFMYCGLRNALGIQVLEAMAYGLPLVTLNQHGIKTFIPDNTGIKVEPIAHRQMIDDLKEALITLYQDTTQRQALGRNAYQFAKSQTWAIKVKQIAKQYSQYIADEKLLTP